jgi:PAS domain-containing protein
MMLAFVSCNGHQGIDLLHAEPAFYSMFGYSARDMPLAFASLMLEEDRDSLLSFFQLALRTSRAVSFELVLKDSHLHEVPCQVSVDASCCARSVASDGDEYLRVAAVMVIQSSNVRSARQL